MAAPLLLNLRVIEPKEPKKNEIFLALTHFSMAESGLLMCCEYDAKRMPQWGVTITEVRGGDFGYFELMHRLDLIAFKEISTSLPSEEINWLKEKTSKLQAISSALSFVLNEYFQGVSGRVPALLPEEVVEHLNEKVFTLTDNQQKNPKADEADNFVYLLPTGADQRQVSKSLAELSELFNNSMPAYYLRGDGAKGELNVLNELSDKAPAEAANESSV